MCTMPQACPTRLPAIKQQRQQGAAVSGTQVVKVRASPMWSDTCYVLDQGCAHRFALLGRWLDEGLSARGSGVVTGGLLRSTRSMAAGADRGADGDLAHPWSRGEGRIDGSPATRNSCGLLKEQTLCWTGARHQAAGLC